MIAAIYSSTSHVTDGGVLTGSGTALLCNVEPPQASVGEQGRDTVLAGNMRSSKQLILFIVYYERDRNPVLTTGQRDTRIRERYSQGEALSDLARNYGISPQRVFQIIRRTTKQ